MKQSISENNFLYEYRMLYRMKLYTKGTEEYTKIGIKVLWTVKLLGKYRDKETKRDNHVKITNFRKATLTQISIVYGLKDCICYLSL